MFNKKDINEEKILKSSFLALDEFTDAIAEVKYRKGFKEIVTFKEIADYAIEEKKKNPKIAAFIISVKANPNPKTENDKLIIIQGLLDSNKTPISLDGTEAESRTIHTKTIDKQFIDVLDGAEIKIITL